MLLLGMVLLAIGIPIGIGIIATNVAKIMTTDR